MTYAAVEGGQPGYTRTPQQVHDLWQQRRRDRSPILAQMKAVRDWVNGDVIIPLPELDQNEQSYVANLVQQGIDHQAMRVAGLMPMVTCPPVNPRSKTAQERADIRRRATVAWWEENGLKRQIRRRARHLVGYGSTPVMLRPDFDRSIPWWQTRNPLDAYPAPTVNPDDLCPSDTIYAVVKPLAWLRAHYTTAAQVLTPAYCRADEPITVLEYEDAEQVMQIACTNVPGGYPQRPQVAVLEQFPNRAECSLSVMPGRITLDRIASQFYGVLGSQQMKAKVMALEILAATKGIYPDTYLTSNIPGDIPEIIGGYKPGYTGEINVLKGGSAVHEVSVNPGFAALQIADRLEREVRVGAGIPAELGGESQSNVRTGRRGDQLLSAALDPGLAEHQDLLAASLEEENYRATKIAKAYFGRRTMSFHVRAKGAKGHVSYTPVKDFDSEYTQVNFPAPGSDANDLIVGIGQRIGAGMMSQDTARRLDPFIDDPDLEGDKVTTESLRKALVDSLLQQAGQGAIPPGDLARIIHLVNVENLEPEEAVERAQREAQERQASETSQGAPDAVAPGSPEAQPGLALPGAGAEAGVTVPEAPASLGRLDQTLMQLRGVGAGG